MDYKIVVDTQDGSVSDETIEAVFDKLNQIIIDGKNVDMKNPALFIPEGDAAALIGTTWGTERAFTEDMEEVSEAFPDLTLYLIQAGNILNQHHFEDLRNYSMMVYRDGLMRERMKPEPITWAVEEVVEYRDNPWG